MTSIYEFSARDIDGEEQSLEQWRSKTLLIVNVASKCGFTPQYKALEALWRERRGQGLVVMGFPCDQFGHQEPDDEPQIRDFCSSRYAVSFPMFAKVEVNGKYAHPLYRWLRREARGVLGSTSIKWNFTKFLIDPAGQVVRRYGSRDTPQKIARDLSA